MFLVVYYLCCVLISINFFLYIVDEHYNGNRSRNAIVRQDLPTAKEEQEREVREAEERYCAFIKEQ